MNDERPISSAQASIPSAVTDGRSGRDQGRRCRPRGPLPTRGWNGPMSKFAYGGSAAAGSADIMINETRP